MHRASVFSLQPLDAPLVYRVERHYISFFQERNKIMDDPVQQLKNDLDEGDFNPHIFRQSIHSSIWELVEQIKLTPEEEGLTPEQEKKLYDIDRNLCANLRINIKEFPSPDY
jgi:hypothetical protein